MTSNKTHFFYFYFLSFAAHWLILWLAYHKMAAAAPGITSRQSSPLEENRDYLFSCLSSHHQRKPFPGAFQKTSLIPLAKIVLHQLLKIIYCKIEREGPLWQACFSHIIWFPLRWWVSEQSGFCQKREQVDESAIIRFD